MHALLRDIPLSGSVIVLMQTFPSSWSAVTRRLYASCSGRKKDIWGLKKGRVKREKIYKFFDPDLPCQIPALLL